MGRRIRIKAVIDYHDLILDRDVYKDEVIEVDRDRAIKICRLGYAKIYSIKRGDNDDRRKKRRTINQS